MEWQQLLEKTLVFGSFAYSLQVPEVAEQLLQRPVSASLCASGRCATSGGDAAAALGVGVRVHAEPAVRQVQGAARSSLDPGAIVSAHQSHRGASPFDARLEAYTTGV